MQVTTVIDDRGRAEGIARSVVEARAAACAQVSGPVTSTYWWQGAVETAEEWAVVAKTTAERAAAAVEAIRAAHSYDVPEILVTPILAGHGDYLAWISAEVASPTS